MRPPLRRRLPSCASRWPVIDAPNQGLAARSPMTKTAAAINAVAEALRAWSEKTVRKLSHKSELDAALLPHASEPDRSRPMLRRRRLARDNSVAERARRSVLRSAAKITSRPQSAVLSHRRACPHRRSPRPVYRRASSLQLAAAGHRSRRRLTPQSHQAVIIEPTWRNNALPSASRHTAEHLDARPNPLRAQTRGAAAARCRNPAQGPLALSRRSA